MFGGKFQAPSPGSCHSPDSTSKKACQTVTPSLGRVKSTPIGYLKCFPENKHVIFLGFLPPLHVFLEGYL